MPFLRPLCITCCLIAPVNAAWAESPFYFGAQYSQFEFDAAQGTIDDGHGYSLLAGIHMKHGLALEFEWADSGDTDFSNPDDTLSSGQVRHYHLAAYGVFRTEGTLYGKLKAGVSVNVLDAHNLQCDGIYCHDDMSDESGSLAIGAGAGLRLGERFRLEADYTRVDSDLNQISLGVTGHF